MENSLTILYRNSDGAIKKIKALEKCNKKSMIKEAFQIYNDLDEAQRNQLVINALLNCCKKVIKRKPDIDAMKVI